MHSNHIIVILFAAISLLAQAASEQLPVDPDLRIGRLDNGLTYYIRHNEQPKWRAEFWLVQNTGSLVEEDDERGMAHFIEHIAFDGTRHFPNIDMVTVLQNNGVSYGRDINASTGFDNTRFKISQVPTVRESLLDSVLLMLRDLSCDLTFDSVAIERERGVIEEEWRQHADYTMRMYEATLPILMPGSRYATRIAIGDMDVVRHLTQDQLTHFYQRWYCPTRQAVFIVGDFDPQRMEQQLRSIMGSVPSCTQPDASPMLGAITDHQGVTYALHTDPEASRSMVYLFFEHEIFPMARRNTMDYLTHNVTSMLVQNMLTERLVQLARSSQSPMDYATVYDQQFIVSHTRDALTMVALSKQGRTMQVLDTLMTCAARAVQHGFVQSELDRARTNAISAFQSMIDEASNRTSSEYVEEYIDHYINGGYVPGVVAESHMLLDALARVTLSDVNGYLMSIVAKDNVSVLISGPQSPVGSTSVYPTSRDVISHWSRTMSTSQTQYEDGQAGETLLKQQPVPGYIIAEYTDTTTGVTTMTLGNGATVRLKPTAWRNSEILFNGLSLGGEWAYGDTADINVRMMDAVVENSAMGGHSVNDLYKLMSGKQLGLVFSLNDPTEQLSGGCVTADVETLMQLCYLYFTDVSVDKEALAVLKNRTRSQIEQAAYDPRMVFSDSIGSTLYCGNPMYRTVRVEDIDKLDGERVLQLYRQRMANIGDWSFSIVGSFTVEQMRPLIERYLASLPDNGHREIAGAYKPMMATGMVDNEFKVAMRNPHTSVYVSMMGDRQYSFDDEFMMNLTGQAVGAALLSCLRQEKQGTYDVAADGTISLYHNRWMINYEFDTSVADRDSMISYADYAAHLIMHNGVSQELFDKIKEQARLEHETSMQTNAYWLRVLQQQALGIDIIGGWERLFPTLTQEKLNAYMRSLRPHTRLRVIMN